MEGLTTKELGTKIRDARKKCGMSQEKLAGILGVTKSTISKYELGHREPSLDQLITIAEALSLAPFALVPEAMQNAYFSGFNRFVETDRYKKATTEEDAEDALDDVLELNQLFNQLDLFGQKRAVACVRALTGKPQIIDTEPSHPIENVVTALYKLNPDGQKIAAERVEELTEIPKYQKKDPQ